MKRYFSLFLVLCLGSATFAQQTKTSVGGYGAATVNINNLAGKANLGVGGYGGVLLNHRWLIGAAGSNVFFSKQMQGSTQSFQYNSYGLYSEYHFTPNKPVHVVAGLMVGAGYVQQKNATSKDRYERVGDWAYAIAPNVGLAIGITNYMRIHTTASYNFSGEINNSNISRNDLSALSGGISLVLGRF